MPGESKRKWYDRLLSQMQQQRTSWEPAWQELADYVAPKRVRITGAQLEHNRGERRNQRIVEPTATFALRTLQAGMLGGITNPSRPWFRFTTPDKDLAEFGDVKEWLALAERRSRDVLLRSNFYKAMPTLYGDFGLLGTGAATILEDPDKLMRMHLHVCGSYWLACGANLEVDTMARRFMLTVRQIVQWFAKPKRGSKTGEYDLSNISPAVRNAYERGQYEEPFEVVHFIHPNQKADPSKLEAKYLPYSSCYYELASEPDVLLSESGFHEKPFIAPRWEVIGENIYGIGPGTDAIPEVKELQHLRKKKSKGLDKLVDPPMVGSPELKQTTPNLLPAGVTYIEERDGKPRFRPAHEISFPLDAITADIQERQFMIRRSFHEDLFLMLANSDRREITAREIEERHEEKLLALGPALSSMDHEGLDPAITRVFNMIIRAGLLPTPPEEIQGVDLKVEYTSIMAQAQKMVSLSGIDRLLAAGANLEKVRPGTMDKIDTDQAIDELGDILGVPPKMIRTDDQVASIREQQQQAIAAQQRAELGATMAKSARDLASADTSGKNALTDSLESLRQQQGTV